MQKNKEIALHVPSITKYHEFYVPTYQDFEAPFRVAEIIYALEDSFFENNGDMVKGEHNHVEFSNNVWIWQVTIQYSIPGSFEQINRLQCILDKIRLNFN